MPRAVASSILPCLSPLPVTALTDSPVRTYLPSPTLIAAAARPKAAGPG